MELIEPQLKCTLHALNKAIMICETCENKPAMCYECLIGDHAADHTFVKASDRA